MCGRELSDAEISELWDPWTPREIAMRLSKVAAPWCVIDSQFPRLSSLPIPPVTRQGVDSRSFRLGEGNDDHTAAATQAVIDYIINDHKAEH